MSDVRADDTASDLEVEALRGRAGSGSLAILLAWRARERPHHWFLSVEEDLGFSFAELAASAQSMAQALRAAGVGRGRRVLVRVGNDERFLPAITAVWLVRGAAVPMHPAASMNDVTRVVASMDVAAVIADPDDEPAHRVDVPVIDVPRLAHGPVTDGSDQLDVPSDVQGDAPALILLTSGSTGLPKGVVLTHDNAWSNLRATVSAFRSDTEPARLPSDEKPPNLLANPLSHTAGIVRLLFALYVGRSLVLMRKFDPVVAQRIIETRGIDNLTINPSMLRMLLDGLPRGVTLGKVRYVSSGTAPLTPALREEFEDRFNVPVLQAYGQTEAFGGIAIESVRDVLEGRRRPGSVGKPLPGVELRLLDSAGRQVEPGMSGEIAVRSASATSGYVADDSPQVVEDGWLRTGDLGRLDEEGYLYITGRLKNVIICGGFNVSPDEVEAALEEDPNVVEAVVISVPDERLGELPVAVIMGSGDPESVRESAATRLAPYKRPRSVIVVDDFPRVPNGKIDRAAVRRDALARLGLAEAVQ
ncbi:class I adenylate-forming enzyme family protein [Parafrankia sp. EUN1f]|uniref:class I adenylate-forming enzyme family protein n=1 Tax=Parafrankia sp. EUN1f TaxID=102897 RepID=UPI0001C47173|nr:fatty acid--CoA ligase family protein [Parafrankia sp. EUN1f]EFC79599.1 AMP-dependent synthetase and ligase [Parafrankia sp. EUN1f]